MTNEERIHILRTYYGYSMQMLADLLGVQQTIHWRCRTKQNITKPRKETCNNTQVPIA